MGARLAWRIARNVACAIPGGRSIVLPREYLAARFGRADAAYAWQVFKHHLTNLKAAGFQNASRTLEIGPGRNIGTGLLWWAHNAAALGGTAEVVLWDLYRNTTVDPRTTWPLLAGELLAAIGPETVPEPTPSMRAMLEEVASGKRHPGIDYRVEGLDALIQHFAPEPFSLVYSHACLEHMWDVGEFWREVPGVTARQGWHSHRIDLADHGRRGSNYVEMLQWSDAMYWVSMRFVPGATNRWRAQQHIDALAERGFTIKLAEREMRPTLPVPVRRLNRRFRTMGEMELRTTAIDLVGVKGR